LRRQRQMCIRDRVWSGLCGWINRLKIALGETY
ncbi:hypothetical protein N2P70_20010, partial [Escherichia coli]|nr:hypothetical protein [Escherichia coli]